LVLVRLVLRAVAKDALGRAATKAKHESIEPHAITLGFLAFSDDPHALIMGARVAARKGRNARRRAALWAGSVTVAWPLAVICRQAFSRVRRAR